MSRHKNEYRHKAEIAMEKVKEIASQSKLECQEIPQISPEQIIIDRNLIGQGNFSQVHRVRVKKSNKFNDRDCYALKCLRNRVLDDINVVEIATFDLAYEADLLSRLSHPHIIKLQAVVDGNDFSSCSLQGNEIGYFLLLDLLDETLKTRLAIWRNYKRQRSSHKHGSHNNHGDICKNHSALRQRIDNIVTSVAKGMEYLHKNNVILRDLKPDNVGFDHRGNVKIFDLGFAREIHTCNKEEIAGSYRYMAPESLPSLTRIYNNNTNPANENNNDDNGKNEVSLSSDVYSFGIMLWELCTLGTPFARISTQKELIEAVVYYQRRPSVRSIPSYALQNLITKCWDTNPTVRPTFSQIVEEVQLKSFPRVLGRRLRSALAEKTTSFKLNRSKSSSSTTSLMSESAASGDGVDTTTSKMKKPSRVTRSQSTETPSSTTFKPKKSPPKPSPIRRSKSAGPPSTTQVNTMSSSSLSSNRDGDIPKNISFDDGLHDSVNSIGIGSNHDGGHGSRVRNNDSESSLDISGNHDGALGRRPRNDRIRRRHNNNNNNNRSGRRHPDHHQRETIKGTNSTVSSDTTGSNNDSGTSGNGFFLNNEDTSIVTY